MRPFLLLIVAAALSAEAPPPALLQQYEQDLATFHFNEARSIVEKLIHDRSPSDGKPRPDPLLNALIGRIYLAAHHSDEAVAYLDNAPLAGLPPALRAPTALDHGRALQLRGDRARALAAYREAAAASENDDERRAAQIGIAGELLPENPAAVRDSLLPMANGAATAQRWEARYLLALSSSLTGDGAAAQHWADEAWADAPSAPLTDLAPVRVEMLRAGLAAAAHNFTAERSMLTAANGLSAVANPALSTQLPVCGDAGIRPSDFVIFGFAGGPFTFEVVPIAASRPEIVAPFQKNFDGTAPIKYASTENPTATVFTVSCRSVVGSYFVASQPSSDPIMLWSVEHGLYPANLSTESDDEHLAQIHDWIDSLATRFGKDSPLLIMPRMQLMTLLTARAHGGDAVLPGQLADLASEIAAGLRHAGAPEWIASSVDAVTEAQKLADAAADGSDQTAAIEALFSKQLLGAPFEFSRPFLLEMLSNIKGDWPPSVAQLILDLNGKTPPSLTGRERQAWQLMVAGALRATGKDKQAQSLVLAAGIPADTCAAADSDPKLLEQHFSYSDYPQDLNVGSQEGAVLFEFDISRSGSVANSRTAYSLPSGLFDAPSAKGLSTVRYTPPLRRGKEAPCRATYQPIRWQLDDGMDFSVPVMATRDLGPTS
jgi:tetratricopeptide (TPR) repeat protein